MAKKSELKANSIDLTIRGPLSVLTARRYKNNYTEVPDTYSDKYVDGLSAIRKALNPEWVQADDSNTLLVKAEDGVLVRVYGPKVYGSSKENQIVIRWGKDLFPLSFSDEGTFDTGNKNLKVSLVSAEKRVNLRVMLVEGDVAHIISLPLATAYDSDADETQAQFDLDPASLLSGLMPVPESNGGSTELTQLESLNTGEPLEVQEVKAAGSGAIVTTASGSFWAPLQLQDFFRLNASAAVGGTFTLVSAKQGERYMEYAATFAKGDFSISGTISLHDLEVGCHTIKGYRTFNTNYGKKAIAFVQQDEFVVPVMTAGIVSSQLCSERSPQDQELTMEIRSIKKPTGNQKNPQVNATLIFEFEEDEEADF